MFKSYDIGYDIYEKKENKMNKKIIEVTVSNENDKKVLQRILGDFTEEDKANSVHLFLTMLQNEEYSLERAYELLTINAELNFTDFIESNIQDRENINEYLKLAKLRAIDVHNAIKKSVEDLGLLGIYQLDFFYKGKGLVTLEGAMG